ncbi:hypothetical protein FA15DRAFT_138908 [Coprinopsis marcescibilis]|uniref:Uncharacterized protein n=1 Tax=Coprinopsis marcescibilis TaxID=230819 RepID=A0A5C3KIT5_COPMA|nr:hypothetical protein FA15DRAFT_138908 [Coprinopsis marcescibilis]
MAAAYRLVTITWIFLAHLAGIYIFTRGFLLMRLSLTDISSCGSNCILEPTHSRAVVLIIDALRFDFVSPNPPSPASPHHHNILTLPHKLTKRYPAHSFLFDSHADPPTTTLQRIKGLTTGSLPTFMDIGNNLGASSITEDSLMVQLQRAGKKAAFMGDDTWMSVFPDSFQPNMTYPYDSFNVEDLHTVDEAVITHIFPLLEDETKPFDFLIGHFLGVDHVGHRFGPDHPIMKDKLQQMNDVLERVVEKLDDDTLLVLLGDHGMDRSGDHGGDSILETSAALWIYSKGDPLTDIRMPIPQDLLKYRIFPGASVEHRAVQQIDLLPTLSLLLGLPIPFNNLGTVIPELFRRGDLLERALRYNAEQIQGFLSTYRASPSGGELDDSWDNLQKAWSAANTAAGFTDFNRQVLAACRTMWAQFNATLMGMGLVLFVVSLAASWALYVGLSSAKSNSKEWLQRNTPLYLMAGCGGGVAGFFFSLVAKLFPSILEGVATTDYIIFGLTFSSGLAIIYISPPIAGLPSISFSSILMILHAAAFLSNSFTVWEDSIIPFFAVSSIIPYVLKGFTAPTSRLQYRIVCFSVIFAICVRLMSISTVCREEQQSFCHVTFYASSSLTVPPTPAVVMAVPTALALPWIIKLYPSISLSDKGIARIYYPIILTPSILGGALYWILEWVDTISAFGDDWSPTIRIIRTWAARTSIGWALFAGGALWFAIPLCVNITVKQLNNKKQVQVIGYGNAFGSPYLIFWSIFLAIIYATTQAPGQLVLALGTVALLSYLEVVDSVRDVQSMTNAFATATPSAILNGPSRNAHISLTFSDTIPIALLAIHAFYTTGHQSTIPSIQWKTAFLLTPTVQYPWSAITVFLNSLGPLFLFALAVPLLALWNQSPQQHNPQDPAANVKNDVTLAAISMMTYYGTLLLGTSIGAAVLRRHLMVWKIFAPRFMAGALGVLAVDLGVLLGVAVGVNRILWYVQKVFKGMNVGEEAKKKH